MADSPRIHILIERPPAELPAHFVGMVWTDKGPMWAMRGVFFDQYGLNPVFAPTWWAFPPLVSETTVEHVEQGIAVLGTEASYLEEDEARSWIRQEVPRPSIKVREAEAALQKALAMAERGRRGT